MMKKTIKALVTTLAAAACVVLFAGNGITAKAAGDTFSVKFVGGDVKEWRYQVGQSFDDTGAHMGISVLVNGMKAGDNVVVYPATGDNAPALDLGTEKKLGSLTIHQGVTAIVKMAGADKVYVLAGSTSAITGDVKSAVVYDKAVCTFNSNVTDLVLNTSGSKASSLTVGGTLGRFCVYSLTEEKKEYEFFDVEKGAFVMTDGVNYTPDNKRKAAASDDYNKTMNEQTTATAPTTPSAPTSTDAGDYDKVPKTGDSYIALYLGLASVLCAAGAMALRKKEN